MLEVFWITPVSSPGEAKLCKDLITDVIMGDHMRQTAGSIQILLGISVCTATIAVVICYIWILLGINIDSPSIRCLLYTSCSAHTRAFLIFFLFHSEA